MGFGEFIRELKAEKKKSSVHGFLKEMVTREELVSPMKEDDWIRVSSLPRMCPQEEILCSIYGITRKKKITDDFEWWTGVGKALHYLFQSEYLGPNGALLGMWRCIRCGASVGGSGVEAARYPIGASCCRFPKHVLVEDTVFDNEFRLVGHPDGVLQIPGRPFAVVDFKSMSSFRFKNVEFSPNLLDVQQLVAYQWMLDIKDGVIVYIDKQSLSMKSAIVEHWIGWQPDVVDLLKRKVSAVREGIAAKRVCGDRLCVSTDDKRTDRCAVSGYCFSKEHGGC